MYLKQLQIVNYKNFSASKFEFNNGTNTIIGENDSGKSNAMNALRILLDDSYYYNTKRLIEDDFSDSLENWKGHWIIISVIFDEITADEKNNEICKDMIIEDISFLNSSIRCENHDYGTITLYIRPNNKIRKKLTKATNSTEFEDIRNKITSNDYEFIYTSRSQADFTDTDTYKKIVGNVDNNEYNNPDDEDTAIVGSKVNITEIWRYISVEFIDALRDVSTDFKKPKNPIRRIVDTIKDKISNDDTNEIKKKIQEVNSTISNVEQISDIGSHINIKLNEMLGLVYSPDVTLQSQMKDDIKALSRFITIKPANKQDIDLLGLGHLNMLYIALKLVEFEFNRNHELINIMIIEEPEAHIHTHIQKTLFTNLRESLNYTQILMTTHSSHLSEVSDIDKINILKKCNKFSEVMQPSNGLNDFGKNIIKLKDVTLSQCLERYLDAKRSVLLFSKGVILVEGDGEEILIPALVKTVFGVTLDELGIGLINIGSVAFENVACIFDTKRLKRYCSIITDMDEIIPGADKCSETAKKRGANRKKKLDKLFINNKYVEIFYAPYTLEVDFANENFNHNFIEKIIDIHYTDERIIKKHKENLKKSECSRYDTVITIAKNIGKGWYATVLSGLISPNVIIPKYILEAIAFACQEIIDPSIIIKIIKYYYNINKKNLDGKVLKSYNSKDIDEKTYIENFCIEFPSHTITNFIKMVQEYYD